MTGQHYRRKQTPIRARRVNADDWDTCDDIAHWCHGHLLDRENFLAFYDNAVIYLAGQYVEDGDWIIHDYGNHFRAMTDQAFRDTYEPID